jgi:Zn-dependent protease with chaperone function
VLVGRRQNPPESDRLATARAIAPNLAAVADAIQAAPVKPEEDPPAPVGPLSEPPSVPMPSFPVARSVPLPGYDVASTSPIKPPAAAVPAQSPEARTEDADPVETAQKPLSDQLPEPLLAWANSLDLAKLSPEDESRLGACLHRIVLSHLKPVEEGPLVERALEAARRVGDSGLTLTVLDSDVVSGFSLPGGHIYLCRGLIDLIGSDEDYALEFVIGHEVAHLKLKHALKTVAANAVEARRRGIDTFNQFLVPIALGYRNALEFEADSWVYKWMITQPDYSKRMCLAFLRKFRDYAERQKFASGGKEPDQDFPLFENHFRAHPAARDRLRRLESFSAEPATRVVK